jgi:hypothetical protein
MASSSNEKDKMPSDDDLQDLELEEEVEIEAEEEEIEERQRSCNCSMIASIGVVNASIGVVKDPSKFKRGSWMSTGGGVPCHTLAPRTSQPGNNPFHTLIHEHQIQKVPRSRLPSGWDIDRSNSAGKESSKCEEGWGNNSKSWDSQADRFMSRIEHNSEMIHNLRYKIDDLRDLIEKLIKDSPPLPKE